MLRFTLFLLPALVFAQTTTNSVTVTATSSTTVAPDQAIVTVYVATPTTGTLDDAVAALQGTGLNSSNLSGLGTIQSVSGRQTVVQIQWSFTLYADLVSLKSTLASLTALQQKSPSVSFSVQGTQVSAKAAQSQPCSLPDLMTNARAQAAQLANAAGRTVGSVLAVSGSASSTATSAGGSAFVNSATVPACTLTVKFALQGGI
jgi:uncharacterized protein YggE